MRNKLLLISLLILMGALFIVQETKQVDAILQINYSQATLPPTRNTIRGSIDINFTYMGPPATNATVEIRRTYNETAFNRVFTLGNSSVNQTVWNLSGAGVYTQFNSTTWTDGNYTINITMWQNNTMAVPILSNLTYWTLYFDNTNPSATITSHADQEIIKTRNPSFFINVASVTNCTFALYYSNTYTYLSNTSTTVGGGTPGTTSCSVTASDLPSSPIDVYALSNDEANSTQGGQIKIFVQSGGYSSSTVVDSSGNAVGGGGGFSIFGDTAQLGTTTSTSEGSSNSGSSTIAIIVIIIIAILIWKKKGPFKRR